MKLDNVFYGFTKDGKRKLLLKRFKKEMTSLGDVERTIFYDLEENKYIESSDIDVESLRSVLSLVGPVKRMTKRKVVKKFKEDNNVLYDIHGVFYGNLVNKLTIYDLKTQNGYYAGTGRNDLYDNILVKEVENVLFARVDDPNGKVEPLKWKERYPWHYKVNSGVSVEEIRPINKEYFDTAVVPKKKLLELDYRKKL